MTMEQTPSDNPDRSISRRSLLKMGAAIAGALIAPVAVVKVVNETVDNTPDMCEGFTPPALLSEKLFVGANHSVYIDSDTARRGIGLAMAQQENCLPEK